MIKAIIFDMDGVLISSMQYHVASWKQAFEKFNIPTEEKDLFYLLEGLSYKETINFLAKKNNIDISEEDKLEIYKVKKEVLEHKFQINIYDGVMEILNYLKEKGLALAVVSGAHGEFVRNITSTFFKDFFDIVVSGTDVEHGKPAPDPYLKAIKDLGIEKDEAIVIENAPIGITSGKSAGLKVFALETTLKKEYLQDADKVFKDHKELFSYLSQLF